jgi:hypothetical protein
MDYLIGISIALFATAALYTWILSKTRSYYEPDNTHIAAAGGIAIILIAFWALCEAGPLPLIGDLPIEALHTMHALCWIAFVPVLIWRRHEKKAQQAKRKAGE